MDIFRLDAGDTVGEFQVASIKRAASWMERMCKDGECLDRIDWRCGYELDRYQGDAGFTECFLDVIDKARPDTTLDAVRKYCGKRFARLSERDGNQSKCKTIGGTWGKLSPMPDIVFVEEEE